MTRSIIPVGREQVLITRQSMVDARAKDQPDEPYGFLCFTLGDEEFGVDLNLVMQVVKPPPLTWVPRMQPHILGVVSIRGSVVTLVDLRQIMGLSQTKWPKSARVLIVEIAQEPIGLLVDAVSQVRRVNPQDLEMKPSLGKGQHTEHVMCVARSGHEKPIMVVDLDSILEENL